jgi:hypothetical protein
LHAAATFFWVQPPFCNRLGESESNVENIRNTFFEQNMMMPKGLTSNKPLLFEIGPSVT